MRKLLKTCVSVPEPTYKTMTVVRQETEDPYTFFLEYRDDAADLYQRDERFDEFFWYRPVLLNSNWQVTAELNPDNFHEDINWNTVNIGSWDNVMIEFPRRWIKMSKEWNIVTLSITDDPHAEDKWFQYYAHSRWTFDNPIAKDYFYLWAYKWRNSAVKWCLVSRSWQAISTLTLQQAIDAARANDWNDWSNWYDIQGFYQRMYIVALHFMKYCEPDVQGTIWPWYVAWTSNPKTWWTNEIWMTGETGEEWGHGRVKLYWLEDLWWAAHEWVGWFKVASTYNAMTALSNFNSTWDWYTTQSWWLATNRQNYNMTWIVWDNTSMFLPSSNVNNSNFDTYYCNNAQILTDRFPYWWWSYNQGSAAGITRFYTWAQNSASGVGTRLMYL